VIEPAHESSIRKEQPYRFRELTEPCTEERGHVEELGIGRGQMRFSLRERRIAKCGQHAVDTRREFAQTVCRLAHGPLERYR